MSVTEEQPETIRGLNRRDLIKKGAVAGAVFWSVPVIESITSRAAAASGCVTFNASWVYVVYTFGGVTYFSGFSLGDTTGHCTPAANPHGTFTVSCGNGFTYELTTGFTTGTNGDIVYGPTATWPTVQTPAIFAGSGTTPSCNTFVTINGGHVTPAQAGVTIIAAFCFGAGHLSGACVSTNSTCANCG